MRYHWEHTEASVVVGGGGDVELDGQRHALREGTVVLIPPLVRHRAIPGRDRLSVVNIVRPPYDSEDEYHDGGV